MKKILLITLLLTIVQTFAQDKSHIARIFYQNENQFRALQEKGLPMDHGYHKKDVFFESEFTDNDLKIVKQLGLNYDIIINNVWQFYMDRNNPESKHYVSKEDALLSTQKYCPPTDDGGIYDYPTPKNWNHGSMVGFLTYEEAMQELDDMYAYCKDKGLNIMTKRADNINPEKPNDLKTTEGRYQQWVKISDNADTDELDEPQILYTSVTHAREVMSLQQLIYYMWFIIENYETSADIQALVNNTELYFIPIVNPDGYKHIHYQYKNMDIENGSRPNHRKNRNGSKNDRNYGVDNNRNFSYISSDGKERWGTVGVSKNKTSDTYPGTGPFSEAETRAIRYFVETHNFKLALNAHSYKNLMLYPFGYSSKAKTKDDALYQQLAKHLAKDNYLTPRQSANLYAHAVNSDDFMYGMLKTKKGGTREKIFAFTPEIGSDADRFWPAKNRIELLAKGMVSTNLMALKLATNHATLKDKSEQNTEAFVFPVNFEITRHGLHLTKAYKVSITPVTENIESVGEPKIFSNLELEETKEAMITVNLKNNIKNGEAFTFKLHLDNGYYTTSQTITKVFGTVTPIFEDNGENLDHWITENWGITKDEYKSNPSSITDSPKGNYTNNTTNTITLKKAIDLSGDHIQNVELSYFAKWAIEDNEDYVQIEASVDNGSTWVPLCGKYTNPGSAEQTDAKNEPVYDGTQANWVEEHINLNEFIGNSITLRFNLVADKEKNDDGFYFDDFKVTILNSKLSTSIFDLDKYISVYPNPVEDILTLNTTLNNYNYAVLNVQGQILMQQNNNSGHSTINYGNLPNGVYLLQVTTNNKRKTIKVVKR